ncbi:MAG: DUF3365 domain-containing protein [candidate division Zixibacteria bacterium]|nr:DUF3365 domain-containing protein [candidate division Zixibacteria bacterium]
MKPIILLMCALLILSCSAEKAEFKNSEKAAEACEILISDFQKSLKSELVKAMTEGGPERAVSVCNTKASEISAGFSEWSGVELKRVSLKQRNAMFAPDEFETIALKAFVADSLGKQPVHQKLVYVSDSLTVFRYMKEIKTGELCLKCHGDPKAFSESLADTLENLYPGDPATGYKAGESRGAFSVILRFPAAEESVKKILGDKSH